VLALAVLAAASAALHAQDALSLVGPRTEVKSIEFRFEGKRTLAEEDLRPKIALTARGGMVGIRRFLGFLPFVPPVGVHPFDPLELQRDVVRLRNHYWRSGFLKADVKYAVRYDARSDLVQIAYIIDEGPPLLVRSLRFVGDSGGLSLPPKFARDWTSFVRREQRNANRFGKDEQRAIGAIRSLRRIQPRLLIRQPTGLMSPSGSVPGSAPGSERSRSAGTTGSPRDT